MMWTGSFKGDDQACLRRKRGAGLVLVETVVVVFLFAVLVVGVLSLAIVGTRAALDNERRVVALGLANEQLEVARSLPYEMVRYAPDGAIQQYRRTERNNQFFDVETRITSLDADADLVRRVEVRVAWDTPLGQRDVHLATYLAEMPTASWQLAISKDGPRNFPHQGGRDGISYNLMVENRGSAAARDVRLVDVVPERLTFDPLRSDQRCQADAGGDEITCATPELLSGDHERFTVYFRVPASVGCGEEIVNESRLLDGEPPDNEAVLNTDVTCRTVNIAVYPPSHGLDPRIRWNDDKGQLQQLSVPLSELNNYLSVLREPYVARIVGGTFVLPPDGVEVGLLPTFPGGGTVAKVPFSGLCTGFTSVQAALSSQSCQNKKVERCDTNCVDFLPILLLTMPPGNADSGVQFLVRSLTSG